MYDVYFGQIRDKFLNLLSVKKDETISWFSKAS